MFRYTDLEPGIYQVFLRDNVSRSVPVSFEVVKAEIRISEVGNGGGTAVYFYSSGTPDYVALSTITGDSTFYPITDEERLQGFVTVPRLDLSEYYCKVIFRGEYGTVTNVPVRVE